MSKLGDQCFVQGIALCFSGAAVGIAFLSLLHHREAFDVGLVLLGAAVVSWNVIRLRDLTRQIVEPSPLSSTYST